MQFAEAFARSLIEEGPISAVGDRLTTDLTLQIARFQVNSASNQNVATQKGLVQRARAIGAICFTLRCLK